MRVMLFYLFLQTAQRLFTGLNLLQYGLVLHYRERPRRGVDLTLTRIVLLQATHTLSLANFLQTQTQKHCCDLQLKADQFVENQMSKIKNLIFIS